MQLSNTQQIVNSSQLTYRETHHGIIFDNNLISPIR